MHCPPIFGTRVTLCYFKPRICPSCGPCEVAPGGGVEREEQQEEFLLEERMEGGPVPLTNRVAVAKQEHVPAAAYYTPSRTKN